MKSVLTLGAGLWAILGGAVAQTDEIVVTGTRIERFQDEEVPAVAITVRPDYVTDVLTLRNDARDEPERRRDIVRTLEAVLSAARRRGDIEVSAFKVFEDDDTYSEITFVVPVPEGRDDRAALIAPTGREDTSMIELLVKTPVSADLAFDEAEKRLTAFADAVDGAGRTTVSNDEDYAVSVRDLQRHRSTLLAAVASDARRTKEAFGAGSVTVEGLENQVRYVRTDLLDLTLYFPYQLTVEID